MLAGAGRSSASAARRPSHTRTKSMSAPRAGGLMTTEWSAPDRARGPHSSGRRFVERSPRCGCLWSAAPSSGGLRGDDNPAPRAHTRQSRIGRSDSTRRVVSTEEGSNEEGEPGTIPAGARSGKTASAGVHHLPCRYHDAMRQAAGRGEARRAAACRFQALNSPAGYPPKPTEPRQSGRLNNTRAPAEGTGAWCGRETTSRCGDDAAGPVVRAEAGVAPPCER